MYLFDLRFFSSSDEIHSKSTDFRIFKYEGKKSQNDPILLAGKKSYCERRGQSWTVSSKSPARLRESLRELEEKLKDEKIILRLWRSSTIFCIIFSSGLISYVTFNVYTGDVTYIFFDRYCVGKIPSNATGAIFTDTHLLFIFPENCTTLVNFNRSANSLRLEKISRRDPRCQTIELYGASRKCEKYVSVSENIADYQDIHVLVWSASVTGDLFPWSPEVRGEDRANVHIYTLNKSQMSLTSYHRTENEVLSVEMSSIHSNLMYIIEQKTYEKSGPSIECTHYETPGGAARRRWAGAVSLPAPARAVSRSACEARLLVACIDASVLLHNELHAVTISVKAAFIPSMVRWADGLVIACEERGRLQCFDLSLSPLPASSTHEDSKFIDIGAHLKRQCTVAHVDCNPKRQDGDGCPQLVMCFHGGPLVLVHITLADVVRRWLSQGQVSRVTSLLRCLSWEREADTCLHILHATVNHLFRKPLSPSSELQLQEVLGTFHTPLTPISAEVVAEYGAPVHDLTRKFFHHLIRYQRLDKALSLAVDLGDSDLFMDVAYAARRGGHAALADEARRHALDALGDHSTCSMSCCSQCTSHSDSGSESDASSARGVGLDYKPTYQRVAPPLPRVPPAPVQSLRPNLHQYLDRDSTIWNDVRETPEFEVKPTHKVVDIIPRPEDETSYGYNIYQAELQETSAISPLWQNIAEGRTYKSVYSQKSAMATRFRPSLVGAPTTSRYDNNLCPRYFEPKAASSKTNGEKNVKFSDTVTIAVVPENPRKEKKIGNNISLECGAHVTDPLKELADSLPLCHPNHDYLRDFAPVTSNGNDPSHDYFEV